MNKEYIIRQQIERAGCSVELVDGNWFSQPFRAILVPLWRKKSSSFEESLTELGADLSEYYHYTGPANHGIDDLSDNALLRYGDTYFEFKHRDRVVVDDKVLYYSAVLRRLKGDFADGA